MVTVRINGLLKKSVDQGEGGREPSGHKTHFSYLLCRKFPVLSLHTHTLFYKWNLQEAIFKLWFYKHELSTLKKHEDAVFNVCVHVSSVRFFVICGQ